MTMSVYDYDYDYEYEYDNQSSQRQSNSSRVRLLKPRRHDRYLTCICGMWQVARLLKRGGNSIILTDSLNVMA